MPSPIYGTSPAPGFFLAGITLFIAIGLVLLLATENKSLGMFLMAFGIFLALSFAFGLLIGLIGAIISLVVINLIYGKFNKINQKITP